MPSDFNHSMVFRHLPRRVQRSRARLLGLVVLVLVAGRAAPVLAENRLTEADYSDEDHIANWLWTYSPDVVDARMQGRLAQAEVVRATLRPNPALDMAVNTLPLGSTNPPTLRNPWLNVPNYNVGLSQMFEIGKRGPRKVLAEAGVTLADASARVVLADRFFDLVAAVGRMALQQTRAEAFVELVKSSEALLQLQRVRATKGDIALLDLTRAEVEYQRLLSARDAALQEIESARFDCSQIAGSTCERFASPADARTYLARGRQLQWPATWTPEIEARRPDLLALQASVQSAHSRAELAHSLALPDLTGRVGYTYDTFEVSGNQTQSISMSLSVSLPTFNHGQAESSAAVAQLEQASRMREVRVRSSTVALQALARRRDLTDARASQLDAALPKAAKVIDALTEAMRRGSASLADVLLARRAYQELLIERLELDAIFHQSVVDMRRAAGILPQPRGQEP